MYSMKKHFVKLYYDDIVNSHYIVKVDKMTYDVVKYNPLWHQLLPVKASFLWIVYRREVWLTLYKHI